MARLFAGWYFSSLWILRSLVHITRVVTSQVIAPVYRQSPGSVREFNAASTMQGSLGRKGFKATDVNHTLGYLFK